MKKTSRRYSMVGENLWWNGKLKGNPGFHHSSTLMVDWFREFHLKSFVGVVKAIAPEGGEFNPSMFAKQASMMHPALVDEFNYKKKRFLRLKRQCVA